MPTMLLDWGDQRLPAAVGAPLVRTAPGVQVAGWLRFESGPGTRAAVRAGFAGIDRPWRILVALYAVLWARYAQRGHQRGPGIWVIEDPTPRRRWGAPESILRPSWGVSPVGPPPVADAPEPSMPEAPAPSRPRPGSGGILHG